MVGQAREVEQRVRKALEADSRTADHPIEVINDSGFVSLGGRVPSAEVKDAALAIARDTEGVMSVSSELVVDPNMDDEDRTLFPPIQPTSQ